MNTYGIKIRTMLEKPKIIIEKANSKSEAICKAVKRLERTDKDLDLGFTDDMKRMDYKRLKVILADQGVRVIEIIEPEVRADGK